MALDTYRRGASLEGEVWIRQFGAVVDRDLLRFGSFYWYWREFLDFYLFAFFVRRGFFERVHQGHSLLHRL